MARDSTQHKPDRMMSHRVHITYDVGIGDTIEMKEIPFVVGVVGDFSGNPGEAGLSLKDRKFIEINLDNFDKVLESMSARLTFEVDNKLTGDDTRLGVELRFKSLHDFHPERLAEQIAPLQELVETRRRLSDLLAKLEGNEKLGELLQDIIVSEDSLAKVGWEAGVKKAE